MDFCLPNSGGLHSTCREKPSRLPSGVVRMQRCCSSFSSLYQLSGNRQSDFALKNFYCFLLGRATEAEPAATAAEQALPPVSRQPAGRGRHPPAPQAWKLRFPACTASAAAEPRPLPARAADGRPRPGLRPRQWSPVGQVLKSVPSPRFSCEF